MRKIFSWQIILGLILIFTSFLVYYLHYLIFKDLHHIFIYLIGDIAFVFIEVLLVTLVLHELLRVREKKNLLKKLNMVIGAFFSEVGLYLLKNFSFFIDKSTIFYKKLLFNEKWQEKDFDRASRDLKNYNYQIQVTSDNLEVLKVFLKEKREFLLNLLENPNLLEHESFTDLLWAVFHLTEELVYRKTLKNLPLDDYQHLANDLARVYKLLISEWLSYLKHLKNKYPYLFSLALRTNPFDSQASIEIKN